MALLLGSSIFLTVLWYSLFENAFAQTSPKQPSTINNGPIFVANSILSSGLAIDYNSTGPTAHVPVTWLGNSTPPFTVTLYSTSSSYSSSSSQSSSSSALPAGDESSIDRQVQFVTANATNNTVDWIPRPSNSSYYGSSVEGYFYLRVVDAKGYYNNTNTFTLEDREAAYTSSSGASDSSDDSLSGGAIAGIVIACVVGVALLIVIGFIWRKRRKARKGRKGRPALPPRPGTKGFEKPELAADETPFWRKWFGKEKGLDPQEMAAADEAAIRSELPGDIPEPVELPVQERVERKKSA